MTGLKTDGHKAEMLMLELLHRFGYEAEKATESEDHGKIDLWLKHSNYWVEIQLSINKEAILSWKGVEALLERGIIPVWTDKLVELEMVVENGNGAEIVENFWDKVEKVLKNFPAVKKFRTPHQTHTQLLK